MISNDDLTQILNKGLQNIQQPQVAPGNNAKEDTKKPEQKSKGFRKMAYAVGGFAAGAAATAGADAMAANKVSTENGSDLVTNESSESTSDSSSDVTNETLNANVAEAPSEEDVILATDEGVRVAQVSDDKTFAEAFSDARAQVGPGGVFEWHGKIFATYNKEEWNQMSTQERADFQARVDYNDVVDGRQEEYYAHHEESVQQSTSENDLNEISQSEELQVSQEEDGGEIRVLGVQEVMTDEGETITIAGVATDDDAVLLVDVDQDGNFDQGWHDDNGDGQIQDDEVFDASGCPVTVDDLIQAEAQQNGTEYASYDDMPDYTNDADVSSLV